MVTYANTKGTITNIDLELATNVDQHDVLAQMFDTQEVTIHNSS
jgi:hypothetical protein